MAYTKPDLRERIKNRIMAGSKGGNSGQWSARKAQLVSQAYEKAGGGYTGGKTKAQSNLKKWTKEKWGYSSLKVEDEVKKTGIKARYLPKKAWSSLSSSEKAATNAKKKEASRSGKQFVANTSAAKSAGRKARNSN